MGYDAKLIVNFCENLIMISVLSGIVGYIVLFLPKRWAPILLGVVFGSFLISTTLHSIPVNAGSSISYKQVIVTLAGYTGGPITAVIAVLIGSLDRLYLSGCGATAGIAVLVFFGWLGCYLRRHYSYKQIDNMMLLLKVGLFIALFYFFIMIAVNGIVNSLTQTILLTRHLFIPLLIFIPIVTLVVFKLFLLQYNCLTYRLFTKAILNSSSVDIAALGEEGKLLFASERLTQNIELKQRLENSVNKYCCEIMAGSKFFNIDVGACGGEKKFAVNISSAPITQNGIGFVAVVHDITDQQKNISELNELKDRFEKLFNASTNPIVIFDKHDGKVCFINSAFQEVIGYRYEEIIGCTQENLKFFGDTHTFEKLMSILRSQSYIRDFEIAYQTKSGEKGIGILTVEPIVVDGKEAWIGIIDDISDRRRLEMELTRLDRLNLVGQMAASIGHEVRNPLTTVKGFLQFMRKKNSDVRNCEHLELMISELDRANDIISEFLNLAKNKMVQKTRTKLNEVLLSLIPLIEADALMGDKSIQTDLHYVADLDLDDKEIRQLILNLCKNGLEAMLPGGILTIQTYDEDEAVILAVQDQGHGISPEVLAEIGTPFVTTKDKGTGLGLPVCYSIARRHNATIKIDTSSYGTCFKVIFAKLT